MNATAIAWNNHAVSQAKQGDYEHAKVSFQRAIDEFTDPIGTGPQIDDQQQLTLKFTLPEKVAATKSVSSKSKKSSKSRRHQLQQSELLQQKQRSEEQEEAHPDAAAAAQDNMNVIQADDCCSVNSDISELTEDSGSEDYYLFNRLHDHANDGKQVSVDPTKSLFKSKGYDEGMLCFSEFLEIPSGNELKMMPNPDQIIYSTVNFNMGIFYSKLQDSDAKEHSLRCFTLAQKVLQDETLVPNSSSSHDLDHSANMSPTPSSTSNKSKKQQLQQNPVNKYTSKRTSMTTKPGFLKSERRLPSFFRSKNKDNNATQDTTSCSSVSSNSHQPLPPHLFKGPTEMAILHNIALMDYQRGTEESLHAALAKYEDILEMTKKAHGSDLFHMDVAYTLNSIGIVRLELDTEGNIEAVQNTLDCFSQALAIFQKINSKQGEAIAMKNTARIMIAQNEFKAALDIYMEVYKMRKAMNGPDDLDAAAVLFNIGETYHLMEQVSDALSMYLKFLPVALKHLKEDHPDIVCVLKIIGDAFNEKQDYDHAFQFYYKSLKCARRVYGEYHVEVASILNRIGNLQYDYGFPDEALLCYQEGLEVERRLYPENDDNLLITMFNIARIHQKLDELEDSLEMYEQGLGIQRTKGPKEALNLASTLCSIGFLQDKLGNYDEAMRSYEEALAIRKEKTGSDDLIVSSTLNAIGLVYYHYEHHAEALAKFQECLAIRNLHPQAKDKDIAAILYNMATVYMNLDPPQMQDAIHFFQKCVELEEKEGRRSGVVNCLKRIAEIHLDQREYDTALDYYEEAIRVYTDAAASLEPEEKGDIATMYGLIGNIQLEFGNEGNATTSIAKAISWNRQAELPDHENLYFDDDVLFEISNQLDEQLGRRARQISKKTTSSRSLDIKDKILEIRTA
jgi:tetratricopeptide (TPR) repeat protein